MKRQYKNYDEELKKTLISLYENGKRLSALSREYGINESTIRSWIKNMELSLHQLVKLQLMMK